MVKGSVVAGASIIAVAILLFGMGEFSQPEIENVQDERIIEEGGKISELQDERIIEERGKISELKDERIIEEGGKISELKDERIIEEKGEISELQDQSPQPVKSTPSQDCSGKARCFTGKVTKIVDGNTIHVAGQSIRLAIVSSPELNKPSGLGAQHFLQQICPVGSNVLVDEDDGQTQGSHGRIVALVYCNGVILNKAVIVDGFGDVSFDSCRKSEFALISWSGCSTNQQLTESESQFYQTKSSCDPSYPDFCIPPSPPDLDCNDIPQKSFTVIGSDPHRFDINGDGIGCEG